MRFVRMFLDEVGPPAVQARVGGVAADVLALQTEVCVYREEQRVQPLPAEDDALPSVPATAETRILSTHLSSGALAQSSGRLRPG